MKVWIAILLAMSLLLGAWACAQADDGSVMRVVNCQEWVSLRAKPDARSECLVEVPLGALVESCRKESRVFYYGEFRGMGGYIMTQYLENIADAPTELSEMTIAGGQWAPMYADTLPNATIMQWMAPGERIQEARAPVDGFVYGICRDVKGYIPAGFVAPLGNAGDEGEK